MDISSEETVTELRLQYVEYFEELLECPICFEIPQTSIGQCISGHNICTSCKDKLTTRGYNCPTCKCTFGTSRNYTVEKMCAIFEDIRSSLLDPNYVSNRRISKKSVGIQTNFECENGPAEQNNRNRSLDTRPDMDIESKQKIPKLETNKQFNL